MSEFLDQKDKILQSSTICTMTSINPMSSNVNNTSYNVDQASNLPVISNAQMNSLIAQYGTNDLVIRPVQRKPEIPLPSTAAAQNGLQKSFTENESKHQPAQMTTISKTTTSKATYTKDSIISFYRETRIPLKKLERQSGIPYSTLYSWLKNDLPSRNSKYPKNSIRQALESYRQGNTFLEIESKFGIPKSAISYYWNKENLKNKSMMYTRKNELTIINAESFNVNKTKENEVGPSGHGSLNYKTDKPMEQTGSAVTPGARGTYENKNRLASHESPNIKSGEPVKIIFPPVFNIANKVNENDVIQISQESSYNKSIGSKPTLPAPAMPMLVANYFHRREVVPNLTKPTNKKNDKPRANRVILPKPDFNAENIDVSDKTPKSHKPSFKKRNETEVKKNSLAMPILSAIDCLNKILNESQLIHINTSAAKNKIQNVK